MVATVSPAVGPVPATAADALVGAVVDSVWAVMSLGAVCMVLCSLPLLRGRHRGCHAPALRGTACQMGRVVRKLGLCDTPGFPQGFVAR
ncbi:hypothetical protein ADL30_13330 [Streptomyces sp. NRRL S-1521]|nr:hypothetical protein ADL30_13330 [Streptomyces sp. NRRL S-1521]